LWWRTRSVRSGDLVHRCVPQETPRGVGRAVQNVDGARERSAKSMRRPLRPGPGKSRNVTTAPRPARALAQYWYLLAPLIILFGWGAMETTLSWRTQEAVDRMIRVVVPGDAELKLEEPGTYTIFHEYHSLVDGRIYTVEGVSGLTIDVLSRS